jgi:hypothetical protein
VFLNKLLRKVGIFVSKRKETIGGHRILHVAELNGLYSSSNIIRMIEYRRMRLEEHEVYTGFWHETLKKINGL